MQDDPAIITVASSPLPDFDPAIMSAKMIVPVPSSIPMEIKLDPVAPGGAAVAAPAPERKYLKGSKGGGAAKRKPSTACKYFAESGFCRKAAQCPFSHDVAAAPKK